MQDQQESAVKPGQNGSNGAANGAHRAPGQAAAGSPGGPANTVAWSSNFAGSEHPETARLRLQRDYIDTITCLKRERADQTYAYLSSLIDKAKEELGHARNASNDNRRAMLQQHIDELAAYVTGHGITVRLPNRQPGAAETAQGFYVVEEIPVFFGEIKFLIDLWYDKHLAKVHDEVSALVGLKRPASSERLLKS